MTTEHLDDGYYLVQQDSPDPRSVARTVYGDIQKYSALREANPEEWYKGDRLIVPHKAGRCTTVRLGDTAQSIIRRMFKNQPVHLYVDRFYLWNGGPDYELQEGELVFVPER